MVSKIQTTSEGLDRRDNAASLDQALDIAGLGLYNVKYSLVLALILIAAILEYLSASIILPAAVCDLQMTDSQRGFISSIPYIGILLTSYPWGYLIDTKGRKKTTIYSCFASGFFSLLAALMPNMYSFAVFKSLTSFCLACTSAVPFMYTGEIVPAKSKDLMVSIVNALQIFGSSLIPLLAWVVLPLDFRIEFGSYHLRSWRLLAAIYSLIPIIAACMMLYGPESPKYLVSRGRYDEALEVLQNIYAGNKGKRPEDYPITKLIIPPNDREKGNFLTSLKVQTVPLLKWNYMKWLLLNGFLFFGMFSLLNGLYMWVPDVLNRVLTGSGSGKTACEIIFDRFNETKMIIKECDDTIDNFVLITNFIGQLSCAIITSIISTSLKIIDKKILIIVVFLVIGTFCTLINHTINATLFAVLLSSFPILVTAMGPVNAYGVEIFPTHLRGMAMSLSLMLGRVGSISGTVIAGLLINTFCESMFYYFGILLLISGALSFLLPKTRVSSPEKETITRL